MSSDKRIKMMKSLFLFPILLFFSFCLFAQTASTQKIKFTQTWVWEYQNSLIPKNEPGYAGEIVVYFEPKLNYWLFTTEAYGNSGEMYNWILGKPDGTYVLCATDEFGKQTITAQKLKFPLNKIMAKHYKLAEKKKAFNQNLFGFQKIEGKEYKVNYLKTIDQSSIFLGDVRANFLPLYFFNRLNIEAKLPFQFPLDLPKNKLLLQEISLVNRKKLQLVFKEISHTDYEIYLKTK